MQNVSGAHSGRNRANEDYRPFADATGSTPGADINRMRIAHALDYIAAQLGQLNHKMDKLTEAIERLSLLDRPGTPETGIEMAGSPDCNTF